MLIRWGPGHRDRDQLGPLLPDERDLLVQRLRQLRRLGLLLPLKSLTPHQTVCSYDGSSHRAPLGLFLAALWRAIEL